MTVALADELDRLAGLDASSLRRRWKTLIGRPPSDQLSPGFLVRVLAYRVQANALGDLDRETARALDQLAFRRGATIPLPEHRPIKPGTLLMREWDGVRHEVLVMGDGFGWDGRTFGSLSKVAQAITGTKWNGPRFFGLRGLASRNGKGSRT